MDYKWTKMFVKKFADDERAFSMTPDEVEWAIRKGFSPEESNCMG